jgi:uncharacterized protein (TIGR00661 family)
MNPMLPNTIHKQRILFSVLNWGMGHLMRCIPLIQILQKQDNEIYIACDDAQKTVFEDLLQSVKYIHLEAYPFQFSGSGKFASDLLRSFFRLHKALRHERNQANRWIQQYAIDYIISDQRLGFYSRKCTSILISHQLQLPLKWHQKGLQWIYQYYLMQFDTIWVPDNADKEKRLSGKLSFSKRKNVYFIGILSRFEKIKCTKKYAIGAIVSGPSPYNKNFLEILLKKFSTLNEPCFIISSVADDQQHGNVKLIRYTASIDMNTLLQEAHLLVSRSGYTTIMDFYTIGAKAILIPTPGQQEQIYLAALLNKKKQFCAQNEQDFLNKTITWAD